MHKKTSFLPLAALALWVALGALGYAASHPILEANIPFDFMVGTSWLPAGTYSIVPVTDQISVLKVRNTESNQTIFVGTIPAIDRKASHPASPRFVFNHYGDQYFLSKVWKGMDNTGRELTKARLERELALHAQPGSTSVAASSR